VESGASHLYERLSSIVFYCIVLYCAIMHRPSRGPWFEHLNNICWSTKYEATRSFLSPPDASHFLGSSILSTLFSNSLNFCSLLRVRDQISNPYEILG